MTSELSSIIIRADIPDSYESRKSIVSAALEAGYRDIMLRKCDTALAHLGRYNAIYSDGESVYSGNEIIGTIVSVNGSEGMEKAYKISTPYEFIDTSDWRVIPLENLISRKNKNTKIYACVKTPAEAKLAFETMEVGCDGIVISAESPEEISAFSKVSDKALPDVKLEEAIVTKITPLSLGDRVCIDTCSLMDAGEGMLIGSSSSCLFLVCSESFESEYVNSRPFRVNAGAVHSYILSPDGTTHYLSEIKAGTELLSRKPNGELRNISTGRVKIELRPLLLIEAEANGKTNSVVLQNAETIRLGTAKGAVSVSDLKEGDKVLVRLEAGGRHFGHAMDETILEK